MARGHLGDRRPRWPRAELAAAPREAPRSQQGAHSRLVSTPGGVRHGAPGVESDVELPHDGAGGSHPRIQGDGLRECVLRELQLDGVHPRQPRERHPSAHDLVDQSLRRCAQDACQHRSERTALRRPGPGELAQVPHRLDDPLARGHRRRRELRGHGWHRGRLRQRPRRRHARRSGRMGAVPRSPAAESGADGDRVRTRQHRVRVELGPALFAGMGHGGHPQVLGDAPPADVGRPIRHWRARLGADDRRGNRASEVDRRRLLRRARRRCAARGDERFVRCARWNGAPHGRPRADLLAARTGSLRGRVAA